jgi:hypothetical protein
MKLSIAGHEWLDQSVDSRCTLVRTDGVDICNMTRSALFQATSSDIGTNGFAHTYALNSAEYQQIVEARDEYQKHCDHLMTALRDMCG